MNRFLFILMTLILISCGKSSGGGAGYQESRKTDSLASSPCQIADGPLQEVAISGYHSLEHCSDEDFAAAVRD